MIRVSLLLIALVVGSAVSAQSSELDDATYIISEQLRPYEGQLEHTAEITVAQMQVAFENMGGEVIDPVRFSEVLLGDFSEVALKKLRSHAISIYLEVLTAEELSALADFYRSDAGQNLLEKGFTPETENDALQFMKEGAGRPLLDHRSDLVASMDDVLSQILEEDLKPIFTMDHMADIMEMSHVIRFETEAQRQEVVAAMREQK